MEENITPVLGPEKSFTGDNVHHFDCPVTENRPTYFVCLHKMKKFDADGTLPEVYSACKAAMEKKSCVAVHMRQEEMLAGRAIYFEQRREYEKPAPRNRGFASPSLLTPQTLMKRPENVVPITKPAPLPKPMIESTLDFASVVNELAKTPPAPVETPVAPPQQPEKVVAEPTPAAAPEAPPKANESLLEMARRLKSKKAAS